MGGHTIVVLHRDYPRGNRLAETKAKIAEEITRIHTTVMKVPKNFVRGVFLSYPRDLALPVESRISEES